VIEISEKSPLLWPEGWERNRIQDRKSAAAWKKSFIAYRTSLSKEMERMGVTEMMISYNPAPSDRMDCGVAVYFSKTKREDYSWQDALGLLTPAPTVDEINTAYRRRAQKVHPDGPNPDPEVFRELGRHRENALAWVRGTSKKEFEFVIACDRFNETRLNLAALRMAVAALRTLERVGASAVLERAFRGFRTALTAGSEEKHAVASS
jgi:hypothetical protein